MSFPEWGQVLPFAGGVLVALIGATFNRLGNKAANRKAEADGEATLSSATLAWALQIRETLEKRISELEIRYERDIKAMSERVGVLERENRTLRGQLWEAGITPAEFFGDG